MITTYLKSKDRAALVALRSWFVNVMEPQQGRSATPEGPVNPETGLSVPAQPAAGDSEYYYTSILAPVAIPAPGGVEVCSAEDGVAVCGVWA